MEALSSNLGSDNAGLPHSLQAHTGTASSLCLQILSDTLFNHPAAVFNAASQITG
jgi:hypothetical protein